MNWRCKIGWHKWSHLHIHRQIFPVYRYDRCKMGSWNVRFFPDRFRWFNY